MHGGSAHGGNPHIVAVMHSVAILVLDDVVPFDMAAPMQAFDWTRLPDGRSPYRVRLCAESPEVRTDGLTLRIDLGLEALETADTIIIVPGRSEEHGPPSERVLAALRRAAGAGTADRVGVRRCLRARGDRAAGRAAGHHPLDGRVRNWPAATRAWRCSRTCCTSTTGRSSPPLAPPPVWTCACT